MSDYAVILKNISKQYALYNRPLLDRFKEHFHRGNKQFHTPFEAVKPISLKIKKGETVGIIGPNGAGKSTLLKLIAAVKPPSTGSVRTHGRIVALLELGAGFNPSFTGMENIYFYCSLLGLSRSETTTLIPAILDFAEIGDYIHQPVKHYSSGMRARLAFSVSITVEPDILILDEILSVGDILFQRKCFSRMEEFFQSGKTILFVSHSVEQVRTLCKRSLLLHKGEVVLDGPSQVVIPQYYRLAYAPLPQHKNLLAQIREIDHDSTRKEEIANDPAFVNLLSELKGPLDKHPEPDTERDFNSLGFESKSRKHVLLKDINIRDYTIEREAGGAVTHIRQGARYRLVFHVDFKETLRQVNFVVWFYSARSQDIAGCYLPGENSPIQEVATGTTYKVNAVFTCHFNLGLYGIRLIVRGENDHIIEPVAMVHDALLFQVLDQNNGGLTKGYVKVLNEWKLEKC